MKIACNRWKYIQIYEAGCTDQVRKLDSIKKPEITAAQNIGFRMFLLYFKAERNILIFLSAFGIDVLDGRFASFFVGRTFSACLRTVIEDNISRRKGMRKLKEGQVMWL